MSEREQKPAGRAADGDKAAHDAAETGAAAPGASADPRQAKWQAIVRGATAYNAAHADLVAEFHKMTGGKCQGDNAGVSVRAVRMWQSEHGLPADGKIGPKTIAAAREGSKDKKPDDKDKNPKSDVTVSDQEAAADAKEPQGDLAEEATAGGETGGEEKVDGVEPSFEGDTLVEDGAKRTGEDIGSDIAKSGEMSGAAKVGVGAVARLAYVPHIVSLLRKHDYKAALKVIWDSVDNADRVELVKAIAEKVGTELSEHALVWFERAAIVGEVADVLGIGWEWTIGGLKAIYEAHEKGDQKARISIYAYAWSDTVLRGEHSAAGAATPEEREAAKRGMEDGFATRERSPELPFMLRAQYHSDTAAREALELALMRKAGL